MPHIERAPGYSGKLTQMPYRTPPKNHQYRIGRVQLGLRRAAIVAPDRQWTTRALMKFTHTMPLHRSGNSYRARLTASRSIRRACEKLAIRVGRRWPDGILWRLRKPE
jgi:hypothetical protein